MTPRVVVRRACPACFHNVTVLANNQLAHHYMQGPGLGQRCPGVPLDPPATAERHHPVWSWNSEAVSNG